MLRRVIAFSFCLAAAAVADVARADSGPVIVIPSRPGIPIVIDGVDASYAVVEGDWGLSRPGHGTVRVIGGTPVMPNAVYHRRYSYHPRYGAPPPRGRFEIEPPPGRELPPPAETFSRSWGTSLEPPPARNAKPRDTQSQLKVGDQDVPATVFDPQTFDPQTFQQPMIVVPQPRGRRP